MATRAKNRHSIGIAAVVIGGDTLLMVSIGFVNPGALRGYRGIRPHRLSCSVARDTEAGNHQDTSSASLVQAVPLGKTGIRHHITQNIGPLENKSFQECVAGEWFGYEAAFSVDDASALVIEERYVPDEFRAWGVDIKGFEVVSSSRVEQVPVDDSVDRSSHLVQQLYIKRTRALPSVGCEADAVASEVHLDCLRAIQDVSVTDAAGKTFRAATIGFADGAFVTAPLFFSPEHCVKWHVCIVDPQSGMDGTPRKRVRLQFGPVNDGRGAITAFVETYDGEFCDGELLPGCGGKNAPFVDNPPVIPSEHLVGKWTVDSTECIPAHIASDNAISSDVREPNFTLRVSKIDSFTLSRSYNECDNEHIVALPEGMTVSLTDLGKDGVNVSAGWLSKEDLRAVLSVQYRADGSLAKVTQSIERKVAEHASVR